MGAETLQEVMQQLSSLTLDEKLELAAVLVDQARQDAALDLNSQTPANGATQEVNGEAKKATDDVPDRYFRREMEWLKQHRHEYPGQYVAIEGDKLFAHGTNGRKALAEARQAGAKRPLMVRIEAEDEFPFGGW